MPPVNEAIAIGTCCKATREHKDVLTRGLVGVVKPLCRTLDVVLLILAMALVVIAAYFTQSEIAFNKFLELRISLNNCLIMLSCSALWHVTLSISGLYTHKSSKSLGSLTRQVAIASILCTAVAACVILMRYQGGNKWTFLSEFLVLSFLFMAVSRVMIICYYAYVRPHFRETKNLIVVGTGPRAQQVYLELLTHPEWNYVLLGFVDSKPLDTLADTGRILGGLDQLESILMRQVVDEVIVVLPMKSKYSEIERCISICERLGIQSQYSTDLFTTSIAKRRHTAESEPNRVILDMVHYDYRRHLKRAIDIVLSLLGIIVLAPLFLAVAIAIKATSNGPVLFKQERYGLNKRTFYMYKFRSMVVDAESKQAQLEHLNETGGPTFKITKDPRITKVGAFIRKTSIDELPQLFNVLKGNMSLVGPRPLPTRDVSRFSEPWLMRRFSVKPGLTCLWQITGRSDTTFNRWMELDLSYIDQWSLSLDMKIIAMTVPAVLKCRGAV